MHNCVSLSSDFYSFVPNGLTTNQVFPYCPHSKAEVSLSRYEIGSVNCKNSLDRGQVGESLSPVKRKNFKCALWFFPFPRAYALPL